VLISPGDAREDSSSKRGQMVMRDIFKGVGHCEVYIFSVNTFGSETVAARSPIHARRADAQFRI